MSIRVFAYEYLSSGAIAGLPEAKSLEREGRAMLAAVVADLQRCNGAQVVTFESEDLTPQPPLPRGEGEQKVSPKVPLILPPSSSPLSPRESGVGGVRSLVPHDERSFRAAAHHSDFALVIAPEFDDILAERCEWVIEEGCRLLGPSVGAVRLTADKLALAEHLTRAGVPTIPTVPFTLTPPWPPPYVCKPRFGAGSQDTFLVHDPASLRDSPGAILQPYLAPRHGPLSLACIGRTPLVLMRQTLSDDGRFHYLGGERALDVDDGPYRELARAAFDAVPGLAGYFGLDLLWPEGADRPVVVEINPRLTTSYVGLREACEGNLMRALLDDALGGDVVPPAFRAGAVSFTVEG